MTAPSGRHDALRDLCAQVHDDDGIEHLRRQRGVRQQTPRKDLQLCAQAARAIADALSTACNDPILRELIITRIEPAPDSGRLRVFAAAAPGSAPFTAQAALERLRAAKGILRAHVADAITRKRVPDLVFGWDANPEDTHDPQA